MTAADREPSAFIKFFLYPIYWLSWLLRDPKMAIRFGSMSATAGGFTLLFSGTEAILFNYILVGLGLAQVLYGFLALSRQFLFWNEVARCPAAPRLSYILSRHLLIQTIAEIALTIIYLNAYRQAGGFEKSFPAQLVAIVIGGWIVLGVNRHYVINILCIRLSKYLLDRKFTAVYATPIARLFAAIPH